MSSTVAGLPGTVGPPDRAGNTRGPASIQMLDGTNGAARLVFESGGRRHAARLNRWIAIIRLERSAVRAARIVWLLDVRTVRWSGGLLVIRLCPDSGRRCVAFVLPPGW